MCMHAKSLQSCPTLCDPMDHSLPSSSVHGILQARILEWSPRPPPGDLPTAGIELMSPALAAAAAKSLQSCVTLCDPIDGSSPGSPVPGILQARTLEWVAILLQCMKVKSEREVAQSCPTLRDPMDCGPPGSSVHGIFQARVLEWGAIAFSE